MSILSNYFDKIYCINLDKRQDRWTTVQSEFAKYGLNDIQRYSAINCLELKGNLLGGEIGILRTHVKLIKECKEQNLNNVLIMEDDVWFSDEINKLDEYMSGVPSDWDMIYFGANLSTCKSVTFITDKIIKINNSFGLQCVAIKNTIFDKIITETSKEEYQIDVYYGNWHDKINAYCFYPNMALQTVGFSDIQNKLVNYDMFFKNF